MRLLFSQNCLFSLNTLKEFWSRGEFLNLKCFFKRSKGLPWGSHGKESASNVRDLGSIPGLVGTPGREHGNPLWSSCLENPHGQRSLAGYNPRGCKESDVTESLSTAQRGKSPLLPCDIWIASISKCNQQVLDYVLCCWWWFNHSAVPNTFRPHRPRSPPGSSVCGISWQEDWSGLPFPSAEDLPNSGMELGSLACRQILQRPSHQGSPWFSLLGINVQIKN